ncbi:MAG: signal peptidase I [Acidimicrobiia bacterium]|nr:signal peptidase I [Acidimicrobiia bacterium]MDH3463982.1 signal peptidase I [Acidimicrobiia bacterium]
MPGLLLTALIIAVVVKTFLIQPFWIPSESMFPTIEVNDRVMVNKLAFSIGDVERGDVVVFRNPLEPHIEESVPDAVIRSVLEAVGIRTRGLDDLIKRVVGLPGDTIEIKDGDLYVNGSILVEPYTDGSFMPDAGPFVVDQETVFVMGDNRDESFDSRRFGNIPLGDLIGRAFVTIWPLSNLGGL